MNVDPIHPTQMDAVTGRVPEPPADLPRGSSARSFIGALLVLAFVVLVVVLVFLVPPPF